MTTNRLERAFAEAAKLPESEQENFADFLLAELEDENHLRELFSNSSDVLTRIADEAREDHRAGRTEPIENLLR
jgi:HSP90 family molecular chaperone